MSKPPDQLTCSFCHNGLHQVKKLIAGPNVFICDECILLSLEIYLESNPYQIRGRKMSKKDLPEVHHELTPAQIKWLDNINHDTSANKSALEVAINYFRNSDVRIREESDKFWAEMHAMLKTEQKVDALKIDGFDGKVYCVKKY